MGAPRGNRNAAGKHGRKTSSRMKTKSGQYVYSTRRKSLTVKKRGLKKMF